MRRPRTMDGGLYRALERGLSSRWVVVLGAWTGVSLFSVGQIYLAQTALGDPPPLDALLLLEVPIWGFWALSTVPIVMLGRRFPLHRDHTGSTLAVHVAAGVAVALVAVAFQMLWYQAFNPYPYSGSSISRWFWQYFRRYFVVGFVIYWAVLGVYHAFTHYFLFRERELEASRARAQLTEARLGALKMQLHPHFLFNSLNSVSALLEKRPGEARRVLAQLADLLRASLRSEARHVIALEDEMDFLERYLDIERIRFRSRLVTCVDVAPHVRRAAVPSFLLQPLVENAIRHGIACREHGGRVEIGAERKGDRLVLRVTDNGPGVDGPIRDGVGLSNTRRRLRELYREDFSLVMTDRPEGGLSVHVEIPYSELAGGP